MARGILADINAIGHVESLVTKMQSAFWKDIWDLLGIELFHFLDFGLSETSTDREIWQLCQAEQLLLVTDNRNHDGEDSLEATIRGLSEPDSLPVFTIGDFERFMHERAFAKRVVESFYDYLLRIDEVRGCGRIYLP